MGESRQGSLTFGEDVWSQQCPGKVSYCFALQAFLFPPPLWTLSKYLQEEPQTATCKEMEGRVDRMSTNDKSEDGLNSGVSPTFCSACCSKRLCMEMLFLLEKVGGGLSKNPRLWA